MDLNRFYDPQYTFLNNKKAMNSIEIERIAFFESKTLSTKK